MSYNSAFAIGAISVILGFEVYDTHATFKKNQKRCNENIDLINKVYQRFPKQLDSWHTFELANQKQFLQQKWYNASTRPPYVSYLPLREVGIMVDHFEDAERKIKELEKPV